MGSSSNDDSLIDTDDTGRLNEFQDADKTSFIGQRDKVSKVDDDVKILFHLILFGLILQP